CHHTYGTPYSF
nr:immunoglobulin light chain junction region [Macaca mulatta]MOX97337.1 immunoglobulin light chain junction region [Macaca mulatta]MOX97548.1 immunoglobulin light chain junction region [Macaca mulatta]MOX97869.1 immunoglobulin light chain junction region [Macaca mulatta]MOX98244.1 immunoglobulin light chain junction region [Macaca mulatta]